MLRQVVRNLYHGSISRNTLRRIGALFVLLAVVISLVVGVGLVTQTAYADIVRPRPSPPQPPPPDELRPTLGDLLQEFSSGDTSGSAFNLQFRREKCWILAIF